MSLLKALLTATEVWKVENYRSNTICKEELEKKLFGKNLKKTNLNQIVWASSGLFS